MLATAACSMFDPATAQVGAMVDIPVAGTVMTYRVAKATADALWMTPVTVWPEMMPFNADDSSNRWERSSLRQWMNGWYHDQLPDWVRARILLQRLPATDGHSDTCTVWAPTEEQVFGTVLLGDAPHSDTGCLFPDETSRRLADTTGEARWWWTRTSSMNRLAVAVSMFGRPLVYGADHRPGGAVPCFTLTRREP